MATMQPFSLAQIYGAADRENAARTHNEIQQFALRKAMRDEQKQMQLADAYKGAFTAPQAAVPGQVVQPLTPGDDEGNPNAPIQMPGTPAIPGGFDPKKLTESLYSKGFGPEAYAFEQQQLKAAQEQRKADLANQKEAIANAGSRLELIGRVLPQVRTVADAQMALQSLQAQGVDVSKVPLPQSDAEIPKWVNDGVMTSLKTKERLDLKNKEIDQLLAREQFDETKKNNIRVDDRIKSEGAANRGVTMRGQNMTDARSRETLAAGKAPAGYRLAPDGKSLEVIPGGPADGKADKLGEGAKKQITGIDALGSAIDSYVKKLEKWNRADIANPNKRAEMGTDYNNVMLQAKEAYNLGVLNGPDYEILQSVIADPNNPKNLLISPEAMIKQANTLKERMAKTREAVKNQGRGEGAPPAEESKPDIQALIRKYGGG